MDFKTKEFNVLTPFAIVTNKDATVADNTRDDIIKIAGYANWCGQDEYGKTYVDLVGDVVVPSGVDTSVWALNPQILWQHERDNTIGEGIILEKRSDGIYIECTIHKGAMDDKDWYRVKSGLVKMFSVGFRTLDGEWKNIDGEDIWYITKCLLLEVSVVSIPANSKSGFSQIKALDSGFTSSKANIEHNSKGELPTNQEETLMNIKVKRADLLSAEDLEKFKELGGSDTEEVEVALASFIKGVVAAEVAEALAAIEKAKQEADEAKRLEDEDAAAEAKRLEDEALAVAEAKRLEDEALAAAEMEADIKSTKQLIADLKALIAATK